MLDNCLRYLPVSFVSPTKRIKRVPEFLGMKSVLGYVFSGLPTVHICNYGVRPVKFEETIVHEMAHVWMFDAANTAAKNDYIRKFWPNARRPSPPQELGTSSYGSTSVYEDFAEAVRYYWQDCPKMKLTHPERWAFINKYVFKGKSYPAKMKIASTNSKTLSATATQP